MNSYLNNNCGDDLREDLRCEPVCEDKCHEVKPICPEPQPRCDYNITIGNCENNCRPCPPKPVVKCDYNLTIGNCDRKCVPCERKPVVKCDYNITIGNCERKCNDNCVDNCVKPAPLPVPDPCAPAPVPYDCGAACMKCQSLRNTCVEVNPNMHLLAEKTERFSGRVEIRDALTCVNGVAPYCVLQYKLTERQLCVNIRIAPIIDDTTELNGNIEVPFAFQAKDSCCMVTEKLTHFTLPIDVVMPAALEDGTYNVYAQIVEGKTDKLTVDGNNIAFDYCLDVMFLAIDKNNCTPADVYLVNAPKCRC